MTSSEPRGTLRIGQVVALTAILLVACAGGQGDNERRAGTSRETNGKHAAGETTRYHCPMHPTMGADKPGDCPICGMRMIADEAAQTGSTAAAQPAPPPRTRVIYRSTMNPGETSDRPGRDSMGMEMERVEVDEGPAGE